MGPLRTFQGEAGIIGRRRGGVSSARESRRSGAAYRGHVGGPARPGRLRGGARDVVPSADTASRVRPGARAHRARGGAERLPLAPASRPRRGPRVLVLAAAAPAAAGWSRAHASGGRARLDEDPRASRGPRGRAVRHARRGDGAGHARQPPARSRGGGLRGRAPRPDPPVRRFRDPEPPPSRARWTFLRGNPSRGRAGRSGGGEGLDSARRLLGRHGGRDLLPRAALLFHGENPASRMLVRRGTRPRALEGMEASPPRRDRRAGGPLRERGGSPDASHASDRGGRDPPPREEATPGAPRRAGGAVSAGVILSAARARPRSGRSWRPILPRPAATPTRGRETARIRGPHRSSRRREELCFGGTFSAPVSFRRSRDAGFLRISKSLSVPTTPAIRGRPA